MPCTDSRLSELNNIFPFREEQIRELEEFYAKFYAAIPAALYVYGVHHVGKTSLCKAYLEKSRINYSIVNCIECFSQRLIYESVISQILPESFHNKRCDTLSEFVNIIETAHNEGHLDNHTVLVFDGIEKLDDMHPTLLYPLVRLQEVTGIRKLGILLIGRRSPLTYSYDESKVFTLFFPQYTKEEALHILSRNKPPDITEKFYNVYLNCTLSTFYWITRDIVELKSLADYNFRKYCEPVESGAVSADDNIGLWKNIAPHFQESLLHVYAGTGVDESPRSLDLPYYAKFFLIAAYIASHNSPNYDRRLFQKDRGSRKRKNNTDNRNVLRFGVRAFSLDRLLAIFYSIIETKASLTVNLMAEIATLTELKLLVRMGEFNIENPKFKCVANFECTDAVAKTVGFDLKKYLIT